jgi:hypothetical protein
MKTKKIYCSPEVEIIQLDSEISLVLQSLLPPVGPDETGSLTPEFFKIEPFKNNMG